jgi:hypothetical protein
MRILSVSIVSDHAGLWGYAGFISILALLLSAPDLTPSEQAALQWSTYLGGIDYDCGRSVDIDTNGCVYLLGYTSSLNFPTSPVSFDTTHNGQFDAFLSKVSTDGSEVIFSTYLGGENSDFGYGIAVDDDGCAFVAGSTESPDFPTTSDAFDTTFDGFSDVFVVKVSPDGNELVYASLLGGVRSDFAYSIALDDSGHAYLTGGTSSADFPTTPGSLDTTHDGCESDAFLVKMSAAGDELLYATYLGGNDLDIGSDVILDEFSTVFLTGWSCSPDFPTTAGAFDTTQSGQCDAFIVKLESGGNILAYGTFLGGTSFDEGISIAVDDSGNAIIVGTTASVDFPTSRSSLDSIHNGSYDVFLTKLNATGTSLVLSSFLGGDGCDYGYSITLDNDHLVHLTGSTESVDFPTTVDALDETHNGGEDVFIVTIDLMNVLLRHSTFWGGSSVDCGYDIISSDAGDLYLSGITGSIDFPTTAGVLGETYNGVRDVFVTKLNAAGVNPDPPGAVEDLTITLCCDHLWLNWSPVTVDTSGHPLAIDLYHIYRDTAISFGDHLNPFDSTTGPPYLDSSAGVGETEKNYFYSVRAVSGGTSSDFSKLTGEFDRHIISEDEFLR